MYTNVADNKQISHLIRLSIAQRKQLFFFDNSNNSFRWRSIIIHLRKDKTFPPYAANKTITNLSLRNVSNYILIIGFINLYSLWKTSFYIIWQWKLFSQQSAAPLLSKFIRMTWIEGNEKGSWGWLCTNNVGISLTFSEKTTFILLE